MAKDILASTGKLPAHLRNFGGADDDWESGAAAGFPVLSIKGKVFHVSRGDDHELVLDPNTGEQATGINIVVLKTHKGVAKTYYAKSYEEGDSEAPTCYSLDGLAPAEDADDRQAKKCAICKHNQFGSRITDSGGKGKACNDQKRLAVAAVGQLNEPMLLRLPPMTLKTWDTYVRLIASKGLRPNSVITRLSFNPSVAYPQLEFKAADFVSEDMIPALEEAIINPVLDSIVGGVAHDTKGGESVPIVDDEDDEDDEDDAPPPPPKKKAAPKKKAKPAPEPEIDEDDDEEADDLDDLDFDDIDFGDD
jgi:hypothetical protein